MFSRIVRWLPRKRKPQRAESPKDHGERAALVKRETAVQASTNWRAIVTAPIEQLCEAPSADTVRYSHLLHLRRLDGSGQGTCRGGTMSLGPLLQDEGRSVNVCQVLSCDRFMYSVLQV